MTTKLFATILCLTLFVLPWRAATAQEWTRFHGPNGSGESEASTVPDTWTEADYNWKVDLPGVGHSSPVLWGDKLFLVNADPATGQRFVLCLSAADGSVLWKNEYPGSAYKIHQYSSFASSTPATDPKHVYLAWATPKKQTLMALDHSGAKVWHADLGNYLTQHGQGTSPILYDDLVVLANEQESPDQIDHGAVEKDSDDDPGEPAGSSLLAFDRATGKLRWKTPRASKVAPFATPCVVRGLDGREQLIFTSNAHGMSSIDPRTGAVNWELPALFDKRTISSPIVVAGLVLGTCGNGGGNNTLVAVRPGDGKDSKPEVAYTIDKTTAPYVPTMVAKGNLLFSWSDKGIVTCIDGATGKALWRERIGGSFFGSPVRVGNRLYCVSTDGEAVVLAAAEKYELVSRTQLGDVCRSTPAVAGGRLYLRTQSRLFSLGGKSAAK